MKALIVANGELYRPEILRARIRVAKFDFVVGVDGGAEKARLLGVSVNAIVGDMDSLSEAEMRSFAAAEIITPSQRKR